MDDRALLLKTKPKLQKLIPLLLAFLLSVGLLFRIANLDQKVFWVDEVATVIRAVGYTKAEVISQLADGSPHTPADLIAYQQITPDRTLLDTLNALARSPEHAPLYFLLVRFWMQCFGSSVSAIRSFSVLCSLLVLPCVYWFSQELFGLNQIGARQSSFHCMNRSTASNPTHLIGWTAVMLMAVSPFFIAYAQEARPYSLWLLTVVLCSGTLLRSIRLDSRESWATYAVMLALSSYTSLLSVLLAIGQGVYVWSVERQFNQTVQRYLIAVSVAALAFLPWVWVILNHQTALEANTTWMRTSIQPLAMVAIWLYSFAVLFFDVPVVAQGWVAFLQATVAAVVLAAIGYAFYQVFQMPRRIGLLLASLCLPIPLTLILFDVIFHGQASATPRYLIPSQFGVLIAVAWLYSSSPKASRRGRKAVLTFLIGISLMSCLVNLHRSPDYQKARNRHNPEIAALLNQAPAPVLLAEPNQTLDLLSLSHSLNNTVQLRILPTARLLPTLNACQPVFLFNPSSTLVTAAHTIPLNLKQIYQPKLFTPEDIHLSLWRIEPASNCSPFHSSKNDVLSSPSHTSR